MKQSLLILTLLLSCVYANAQVVVNQTPIPQKIASYYNLINVNIVNTSGASIEGASMRYEVFHGRSSSNELIAKGTSASFAIPRTGLSINSANYQALLGPLKEERRPKQDFLDYIVQTGNVPPGKVKVCITILSKDQKVIGTSCQESNVLQTTSLFLIAPSNKSKLSSQWPTFSWSSTSMGGGATYEIVITQIIGNQSGQQAIQQNPTFYTQKVNANLLQYNMGSQPFKNEGRYVWYIRQIIGKEEIAKSELWEFTYSELKKPKGDSPIKVKTPGDIKTPSGGSTFTKEPKQKNECIAVSIPRRLANAEYNVQFDEKPVFQWNVNTDKTLKYEFSLYEFDQENPFPKEKSAKPIFQTTTKSSSMEWPQKVKLPKELKDGETRSYMWAVQILDDLPNVCVPGASGMVAFGSFGFGVEFDTMYAECLNPAYDSLGFVCYKVTEKWKIKSSSSSPTTYDFISHNILSPVTANVPSPAANSHFGSVTVSNSTSPLSLPPYVYTICLPVGSSVIVTELYYEQNGSSLPPKSDWQGDSLDLCICDECEDWDFKFKNDKITSIVNANATQDYIQIEEDISATSPFGPIVRVDAEIIDYNYNSKEPCITCNNKDGQHGVFLPYKDASGNVLTNKLSTGFKTNDIGVYQINSAAPSREVFWEAVAPSGVSMPLRSNLTIGVPNFSPLIDCCKDRIEICIRYTFTAFDDEKGCRKCSVVQCYRISRDKNSITIDNTPQPSY